MIDYAREGGLAGIAFIAALPEVEAFRSYSEVDEPIAELLREARSLLDDIVGEAVESLETAEELTEEVHRGLRAADASAIEAATGRLETLALEFRVLEQEYRRLPAPAREGGTRALDRARADLERTSLRVARSAAVGSGLLARLVAVSRNLIATMGTGPGESYLPDGRPREMPFEGFRLKEMA